MTPRQFNELQRQAEVIEAHAKSMSPVEQAVRLFIETIPLEKMDAQDPRFHELYEKECKLFSLMAEFTIKETSEYKKRIKSEKFKWMIKKVKGFFMLPEDHDFHDEGHGYIETLAEWGGMQVTVYVYRDVKRGVEFFVDVFDTVERFKVLDTRRKKEKELTEEFSQYLNNNSSKNK